jgi:folate-binding protein YgfZ
MPDDLPPPLVIGPDAVPPDDAGAVLDGALVAEADVVVFDVSGSGAVSCMQGLLTCDIEKPGDGSYLYGGLLTPKGMLITDLWVGRGVGNVTLRVPRAGAAPLLEVLRRSLPPRLARVTDLSAEHTVLRLVGPAALEVAGRAGLAVPAEGRVANAVGGGMLAVVAHPSAGGPFGLEVLTSRANADGLRRRFADAGARVGTSTALDLARVLAGWPGLGAEIDDRTLPQEVRFDELGGVSYTKGCYVGQETVARLHFRGHANRHLRGLVWDEPPDPVNPSVSQDDKPRGRVTTMVWVAALERWLGLGIVRRELDLDRPVLAANQPATAVALPFALAA